jgi:hypothetical protein
MRESSTTPEHSMSDKFDRHLNGEIICLHLVEYELERWRGARCAMRLGYVYAVEDLDRRARGATIPNLQVEMTAAMCRDLGIKLLTMAASLEPPPPVLN